MTFKQNKSYVIFDIESNKKKKPNSNAKLFIININNYFKCIIYYKIFLWFFWGELNLYKQYNSLNDNKILC